ALFGQPFKLPESALKRRAKLFLLLPNSLLDIDEARVHGWIGPLVFLRDDLSNARESTRLDGEKVCVPHRPAQKPADKVSLFSIARHYPVSDHKDSTAH